MHPLRMLGAATIAVFVWSPQTHGLSVTTYTDKAAWEASLSGPFLTEDFNDGVLNDGVSFESSESGHVNPAGGYYQDVLASQSQNEPTTLWTFDSAIVAYGGNWSLGGPGGSGNSLLVYIADSAELVEAIPNSFGGEFWGFVCDAPFSTIQLIGGLGVHQQTYQLDDMVYSPFAPPPGDFDLDGDIDGDDLLAWQRGESPNPLSSSDLDLWQSGFGGVAIAAFAAPEQTTWLLAVLGCMVSFASRDARGRRAP